MGTPRPRPRPIPNLVVEEVEEEVDPCVSDRGAVVEEARAPKPVVEPVVFGVVAVDVVEEELPVEVEELTEDVVFEAVADEVLLLVGLVIAFSVKLK